MEALEVLLTCETIGCVFLFNAKNLWAYRALEDDWDEKYSTWYLIVIMIWATPCSYQIYLSLLSSVIRFPVWRGTYRHNPQCWLCPSQTDVRLWLYSVLHSYKLNKPCSDKQDIFRKSTDPRLVCVFSTWSFAACLIRLDELVRCNMNAACVCVCVSNAGRRQSKVRWLFSLLTCWPRPSY